MEQKESITNLTKGKDNYQKEITSLKRTISNLKNKFASLTKERDDIHKENLQHTKEKQNLENVVLNLKQDIKNQEEQIESLQEQLLHVTLDLSKESVELVGDLNSDLVTNNDNTHLNSHDSPSPTRDDDDNTGDTIYFKGPSHILSNLYPCTLQLYSHTYCSAEQAYQHKKAMFHIDKTRNEKDKQELRKISHDIMDTEDPYKIMSIAKQIKPNQEWQTTKRYIMEEVLQAKAAQCNAYKDYLLLTERKSYIEDTAHLTWGRGKPNKPGNNLLGLLHEKIRGEVFVNDITEKAINIGIKVPDSPPFKGYDTTPQKPRVYQNPPQEHPQVLTIPAKQTQQVPRKLNPPNQPKLEKSKPLSATSQPESTVKPQVLLVGDSMVSHVQLNIPAKVVAHRSATVEDIEQKINQYVTPETKDIFLLVGTNNIPYESPQLIVNKYNSLIRRVKSATPHSNVYVLGIYHRCDRNDSVALNRKIDSVNQSLQKLWGTSAYLLTNSPQPHSLTHIE